MDGVFPAKAKRIDTGGWATGYYASDGKRHYIITAIRDTEHALWGHYSNDVELYIVDPETVQQDAGTVDR